MYTINAANMHRDSSETSFLRKALDYPNYSVYPSTQAKKILFGPDKQATGVLVDTRGARYTLRATKEVIVSAGVFGSPQLLMVSGVGPAETLRRHGIPIVAHRPGVGQNMEDQVMFGLSYRVNGRTISALNDAAFAARAARKFTEKAAGIYTNPGTDVFGWEKLPQPLRRTLSPRTRRILEMYPHDWPEIEYASANYFFGDQFQPRGSDPNDGFNYASLIAVLGAPQSRGNVTIRSADTAVPPVIDPNFFSDPADMDVAIASYKRLRQFRRTKAVQPFVVAPGEVYPGLNVSTDAEIETAVRKGFNTIYHAACTCAMGKPGDRFAVVDTRRNDSAPWLIFLPL
ncbi:hypothetical protein CDD83_10482 [Cordyceps sp. RAO-2017]|nr:hypothetical protein CDD83_10482 [Cordyceps sp. RAO-2017]